MADPFDLPYPFGYSATREQRISAEIVCHQPPMPAFLPNSACNPMNNPPNRTHSAYFKTRMCPRFISGFCPKGGNCNFAHSIEELRRPHGIGDGRVIFPQEDRYARNEHNPRSCSELSGLCEEQKLNMNNICRKFYNGEICPFGIKCTFSHIGPGSFKDCSVSNPRPLCWKTRICHKWSTSGNCPYGDHCSYAHGDADLRKVGDHGELLVEGSADATSNYVVNLTDDVLTKKAKTELVEFSSALEPQPKSRILTLKKINRIYGDWIEDIV